MHAAVGALVFLAAFLYFFWRVGKLWPGVPLPTDGIFRMKQVHFFLRMPSGPKTYVRFPTIPDNRTLIVGLLMPPMSRF